ncbi:3-carboxy-cis,cis-muconate cycloisomerase [Rubrobacter xylanophilus DSM 9941]|uniref:3-carboxy-cis,cis-muconate cycloisomerase n=1 Tax=Rubrobacter xylanophilus TaxID=49319 RepID=UPI001C6420AD|nr:3-carboxy-cis,cis-muconate cycloisomerase [Rubrobacter xylanophilus]QYJ14813.1 3-carboxy-cis,cis-muconate cycloisomerase [Rubrobacter xylanophilus DSM 9941]
MSGELFGPIFVPERFREAVSDRAWLQAMLDAEAALARAEARVGLIGGEVAEAIAACCRAELYDPRVIGERAPAAGNPVPALVKELTARVSRDSEEAARHVHRGATSQDITDTAAMLVSREVLGLILSELDALCAACARLAAEHRGTLMPARTLLQQALPTTFGLKAAGWLVSALEVRGRLREAREGGLAAQLGGAAGTLASLGEKGPEVLREYSRELGLPEPVLPWHTARFRIAELGGALALAAGTLHKIALDVILMAQTEVGEVAEPAGEGRGGSSTLPHKRNPILSVTAAANARRVQDLARTLYGALVQEHERAAGAWHAEWETLSDALALTGGAAAAVREVVEGLQVHPERMRGNLGITEGLILAENVTTLAADRLGRLEAHELVEAACRRVAEGGGTLREEILAEPRLSEALGEEEVDAALDPAHYLGASERFVDRALEKYRREVQ